ncbi:MAG TPA: PEGA domain-containing protein, partial [Thermotogota bacterium]|nr:PEGA domain-containing protein [Thermotogota bacterium]
GGRVTLSLDAGSHTLTVSKRNYESKTIPFTIIGNQLTTLNVTLASSRGSMEITSEPDGAAIYINGRDTGYRTSVSGTLTMTIDPGTYEIMLKKDGYQDWIQTMTINPGVNTPLHVTLQPNTAKITITPNVSAVLYIDGKSFGTISTGRTFTHNVLPGNHEILLVKEGYYSFISIFAMEAGETYDFNPYLSLIY